MIDKQGRGFVAVKNGDTVIAEASWTEKAFFLTIRDNSKSKVKGPYVFSTEAVLDAFLAGIAREYRDNGWQITQLSRI